MVFRRFDTSLKIAYGIIIDDNNNLVNFLLHIFVEYDTS